MTPRHALVCDRPARRWVEALPIGNGNLGAMCHGGVACELLQLNDDAFWSGAPDPWDVDIRDAIERSRTAAPAGDSVESDAAARQAQGARSRRAICRSRISRSSSRTATRRSPSTRGRSISTAVS